MAIIDNILIPSDFSGSAENICRFAKKLFGRTHGVVDLLQVIPNSVMIDEQIRESAKGDQDPGDEIFPLIFHEAELKPNSLSKKCFQYKNRGEIYVKVDRSPAYVIADQAWDGNYSLIVNSAKGKHKSGWFRESITENVIRASKTLVFNVFEHPEKVALNTEKTVLTIRPDSKLFKKHNTQTPDS